MLELIEDDPKRKQSRSLCASVLFLPRFPDSSAAADDGGPTEGLSTMTTASPGLASHGSDLHLRKWGKGRRRSPALLGATLSVISTQPKPPQKQQ